MRSTHSLSLFACEVPTSPYPILSVGAAPALPSWVSECSKPCRSPFSLGSVERETRRRCAERWTTRGGRAALGEVRRRGEVHSGETQLDRAVPESAWRGVQGKRAGPCKRGPSRTVPCRGAQKSVQRLRRCTTEYPAGKCHTRGVPSRTVPYQRARKKERSAWRSAQGKRVGPCSRGPSRTVSYRRHASKSAKRLESCAAVDPAGLRRNGGRA